jgi:4-carboxymuconolactone decarboxylase
MIWVMYPRPAAPTVGVDRLDVRAAGERVAVDYTEVLRLLALNDEHFVEECSRGHGLASSRLDPKTLALVRLAALVAVGGAVPSYGAATDAAVSCGATTAEMVDVLVGVVSVVGLPGVVAAAPSLATALGYDITEALEQSNGR